MIVKFILKKMNANQSNVFHVFVVLPPSCKMEIKKYREAPRAVPILSKKNCAFVKLTVIDAIIRVMSITER